MISRIDLLNLLKEVETSDRTPETILAVLTARLWDMVDNDREIQVDAAPKPLVVKEKEKSGFEY